MGGQAAEPAVAQQQAGRRLEKRSQMPLLGIATPRVMTALSELHPEE